MEELLLQIKLQILEEEGIEIQDLSEVEDYEFDQAYVDELMAPHLEAIAEQERKEDIANRLAALKDKNYAHAILRPNIPNAALFIKQKIEENEDHAEAELLLSELEAKDSELQAEIKAKEYIELRKKEYPSVEDLIVAMWEKDEVKIAELELQRQQVKAKYPKGM